MTPPQRIIAADLGSDLGNRLVSLTLLDLLFFNGNNPLWHLVGLTLAEQVPSIVLSPFAGAAVDRFGAGRLLIITLAGKCLVTVALLFCPHTFAALSLYFFLIGTSVCFNLGRIALIPGVVPPHKLIVFNALNEGIAVVGGIVTFALMGRIIAATGKSGALQIAGLFFLAAFGIVFKLARQNIPEKKNGKCHEYPEADPPQIPNQRQIKDRQHHLRPYFLLMGSTVIAGGLLNFTMPQLLKNRFGGDIAHWGVMMAYYQTGGATAALLLPRSKTILGLRRLLTLTFSLLAGATASLALSTSVLGTRVLVFFAGWGFTLLHIVLESLIQQHSPRSRRGRIASRIIMLRGLCYCGTSLSGAYVSNRYSPGTSILIGALVLLTAAPAVVRISSPSQQTH